MGESYGLSHCVYEEGGGRVRFLMIPNTTNPQAQACAENLMASIRRAGHEAMLRSQADEAWLTSAELAVAVGGDGTVLRAVRDLHPLSDMPIWAVNCGHLGYLTDCEPQGAEQALERILAGKYHMENRVMLEGKLLSQGEETSFFALNEVVIYRSAFSHTLKMQLLIDGMPVVKLAGDGIMVSTPTGSTAYNLSAGGPILLPEAVQAVVTPICPHAALCAPLVVSGNETVTVAVTMNERVRDGEQPQLVIDGIRRIPVKSGDQVVCAVASRRVRFVRTDDEGFYGRLQKKLTQND